MISNKSSRTIAILGATGSTGGAILSNLLLQPASSLHINIYVRSPERLEAKHPEIKDRKNVSIFSGSMSSSSLKPCLKDADIVLNAIGSNKPAPGQSLTQETAAAIVTALEELSAENMRQNLDSNIPHLVILSSGSCNEAFVKNEAWLLRAFVNNGLYYSYEDLRLATAYYRREGEATGLLRLSVACPGAIAQHPDGMDTPAGRGEDLRLSTTEYTPMVTYQELARGMIEITEHPDMWMGKEVLFVSSQEPDYRQLLSLIVRNIVPGLMITFIPSLYPILNKIGWL